MRQQFKAEAVEGWVPDKSGVLVPVLGDFWEPNPCDEENCAQFVLGFKTSLDESVPRLHEAAEWLRHNSGLHFTETKDDEGLTAFFFPPGQQCFRGKTGGHMEPTGKPGKLFWESEAGRRDFTRPKDFNEAMNIEADRASRVIQRG